MRRRLVRLIAGSALLAAAPCVGSCSPAESAVPRDAVPPELADVIFEGGASSQALAQLLAGPPKYDEARYPEFTAPKEGASLPASVPFTFEWRLMVQEAQTPALEGDAFYVLFSTKVDENYLRVFTTRTSYAPGAAAWEKLAAAGEPMSGWLLTGTFRDGELISDRNESTWVSFQVVP